MKKNTEKFSYIKIYLTKIAIKAKINGRLGNVFPTHVTDNRFGSGYISRYIYGTQ